MSDFDCSIQEIRVGDTGTRLEIEMLDECSPVDISVASLKEVTVKRPDTTTFTREADFTTDGTDGKIYLTTVADDLTLSGTYFIQARIVLPTWSGSSSVSDFEVFDNLG